MTQAHTPGKWHVTPPTDTLHAVRASRNRIVADVGYSSTLEENDANARRIVACVNACDGVPLDWLESALPGSVQNVRDERDQYRNERNQLLAALAGVVRVADRDTDEFIAARAAIATATGAA